MFQTPYDTTPCDSYDQALIQIRRALGQAMTNNELVIANTLEGEACDGLWMVPPYLKSVPQFGHPLMLEHFGKRYVVIDARPFIRQSQTGEIKVASSTEYRFLLTRGLLMQAWLAGEQADMVNVGDIAPKVFSRFLSEGIVRRLGLSPSDQLRLTVLSAFFYFCQFSPQLAYGEDDQVKLAQRISRLTTINVERVLEVFHILVDEETLPAIGNMSDYCEAARRVCESPRLQSLDLRLLYATVGGGWFGANARENVAVALEYPPTFLAMVYMALTDRSYHKAFFTQLVEQVDRSGLGKTFVMRLTTFLEPGSYV